MPIQLWSECSVASTCGGWKRALACQTSARRKTDWKLLAETNTCKLINHPIDFKLFRTNELKHLRCKLIWLAPCNSISRHGDFLKRSRRSFLELSGVSWPVITIHLAKVSACFRSSSSLYQTFRSKKAWFCPSMVSRWWRVINTRFRRVSDNASDSVGLWASESDN